MKLPVVLRIFRGDKLEDVKQFQTEQIIVGRNAETSLSLDDDSISPVHFVIEERESGYFVSDLGSQTGTYKSGKKILDESLVSGDDIVVGPYRIQFFVGAPRVGHVAPTAEVKASDPTPPPVPPKPTQTKVSSSPIVPTADTPPPVEKVASIKDNDDFMKAAELTPVVSDDDHVLDLTDPGISHAASSVVESATGTYAPASEIKNLAKVIKPGKGTAVEVIVAWRERIIGNFTFNEKRTITMGSSGDADIVIPLLGSKKSKHPFLKIGPLATVCVTVEMTGEYIAESGVATHFGDLMRQQRMIKSAHGYDIQVNQGEMVRIGLQGDLVSVYVRYVPEAPKPLVAPLLDLTASEVTGVMLAVVVAAIFGLYMMVYSPSPLEDESKLEEPIRKAIVTFKPRPKPEVVEAIKDKTEKKIVEVKDKVVPNKEKTQAAAAQTKKEQGKAAEAKPNPNQNKPKKLTSNREGGAINTKKSGASTKSQKPDPSKQGLLGVFGSKGTQSKLDQVYSGAGELQGIADSATGFAGQDSDRAGDNIGSKLKNVGAGGSGAASEGIAGVGTVGKGSGAFGYGTGGIGKKGSVDINVGGAEAEFEGSIDREAIRRVIMNHKREIQNCYNRALNTNPDIYGKLVLEWDIEEKGRVGRAGTKSNSLGNSQVASCIINRLKTWKFPEPPPNQVARVTYPFVFTSQ